MRLMFSLVCLAPLAAWAQPAKVLQETSLRRGADGEVTGRLPAGTELVVLSRVTTETGTWCRVQGAAAGSVPCRDLAISRPEPPPVVLAQPMLPPGAGKLAAKPVKAKAPAPPPDLLVAPTAKEMSKIMTGLGAVTTTLPVDDTSLAILQEYKFSSNDDLKLVLWIRPTGDSLGAASADIAAALSAEPTRVQKESLSGNRRMRVGKTPDGIMITAPSPAGDYEWTMVYTTSDSFDDVVGQLTDAARQIDRLLFY